MPGAVAPAIANASSQRRVRVKTLRRIAGVAVWHGVLIMACAFVLVPIVMVVLGSFKTVNEFFASPYGLPESFGLHNYQKAFAEANLPIALRNSIVSTGLGVAISTMLAGLAAYGLARFRFAGRLATRLLFIGGLVVPVQLIILPLFIMFRQIAKDTDLPEHDEERQDDQLHGHHQPTDEEQARRQPSREAEAGQTICRQSGQRGADRDAQPGRDDAVA